MSHAAPSGPEHQPNYAATGHAIAAPHPAHVISPAYGRFYAPLAILSSLLTVVPIFETVMVSEGHTRTFGNLWQMAGTPGGAPAVAGILLLGIVVGLLVTAAVRPTRHPALPGSIAGLAILLLVMLIARPATGAPKPDFSPFGSIGILIALIIIAIGVTHAIHLGVLARSVPRPAAPPQSPPQNQSLL